MHCGCIRDAISRCVGARAALSNSTQPPLLLLWGCDSSCKQTPSLVSSSRTQKDIPKHHSIIGYPYFQQHKGQRQPGQSDFKQGLGCRAIARADTDRAVVSVESWQTGTERAAVETVFLSPAFDLSQLWSLLRIARPDDPARLNSSFADRPTSGPPRSLPLPPPPT